MCASAPMPSSTRSAGGRAAMRASAAAAASASGGSGPGAISGTKRAAAAGPCSRCVRTRRSLRSGWPSATQRSSTRVTVICAQGRAWLRRASNSATGERPPETASVAAPRPATAARSVSATVATRPARASSAGACRSCRCGQRACRAEARPAATGSAMLRPPRTRPGPRAPSAPSWRPGPRCRRRSRAGVRRAASSRRGWARPRSRRPPVRRGA